MRKLLSGNKRFLIIATVVLLGFIFWPLVLAALFIWQIQTKVKDKKLRLFSLFCVLLFIIFFGSAWMVTLSRPSHTQTTTFQNAQTSPFDSNKSLLTNQFEIPPEPSDSGTETNSDIPNFESVKVVAVVDGDTIDVDIGDGQIKRLRYIGIDAPESVDPNQPIQCFSKDATARNKELVNGQIVRLEKDKSETDRYGRLLRYVYVGDLLINQVLVAEGFAYATAYPPDTKYQSLIDHAETQAINARVGLWSVCDVESPTPTKVTTKTSPTNTPSKNNNSTQTNTGGVCKYSCSSPDRDCSDFSSHTEAQVFFDCCRFSAQNDPMKLDAVGVGDGIACENI